MIKHTPKLWGLFYYSTAKIDPDSLVQRFFNAIGYKALIKLISLFCPDVVVCTYPTIAGMLAQLRIKQIIQVPVVAIVTDYAVHSQWIHQGVDLYLVGCQDVCDGLSSHGIDTERIKVTGIPVHPKFELEINRQILLKKFGLLPHRTIILVMGGAYGVLGGIRGICKKLAFAPKPLQTIVVCGKDEKLYKSLEDLVTVAQNPIRLFGFVSNVEEFMTVSDLIITKAGGLTVSEALTKGLPVVIHRPIQGQEEENSNFIQKIGAGIVCYTIEELENTLDHLLNNYGELKKMSLAASNATPGHSAERVVDNVLALVQRTECKVKTG